MLDRLIQRILETGPASEKYIQLFTEINIAAKTTLVREGDPLRSIYFIKNGCLRLWFNSNGNDITYQFFFENQPVSGFLDDGRSLFSLESIEHSTIWTIKKNDFGKLLNQLPELKDEYLEYVLQRLALYSKLFLSRIKDSPAVRYEQFVKESPEIVARIPQHYIATFLGITPVSLSRIRNRKKARKIN
jgi:CRP-like cAMP-binding protein